MKLLWDEAEALQVEESLSDHSQSSVLSNYDYPEGVFRVQFLGLN